jgi:PAS domain S-box-containing protein
MLDARILIVDDQEADAQLMATMLAAAGYSWVTVTTDPHAAAGLHRKHRYDLLILDILMPGIDGFGVMAAIKGIDPENHVPVIVVTADPDHVKRALEMGARDFISKPVRLAELRARVRNVLELGMFLRKLKARGSDLERLLDERTADLQDAEGRFRALVEQSIVGIYIVEGGRYIYANPHMCALLGYTADELRVIGTIDLVLEEDRERFAANRRRREVEPSFSATYRFRRKDGGIRHLSLSGKMVELKGRKVIFGVAEDVTEHVRAQELLRDSEEKYRVLWETTTDAVVLLDQDMRIQYANPSVREVFGYAPEEIEGRDLALLQPGRWREPHRRAMTRYLQTGVRTMDWRATETIGLHRDGHEFPVEIAFSHVAIGGRSIFAGFMRDITQRKGAQAAVENANERLRVLSRRVLAVQEEERRAISNELHDDVGQSLVALKIGLHRLEGHLVGAQRELLAECVDVVDAVQEKLREISVELHPPQLDQLGLPEALRWLVSRQGGMTGLAIECRINGVEGASIPREVASACYRISQEALNNATRHSRASNIRLELESREGSLELCIGDDGVGFDEPSKRQAALQSGSLGLISMEERARLAGGRLKLHTSPGAGSRVVVRFPLDEAARAAVVRKRAHAPSP